MPIEYTDKKHYYRHGAKKVFRIGMNVSQGSYAEKGDWLPCYALTCQRQKCRDAFRHLRFEPALRMVARNSNLRMLTVSKMNPNHLNQFARDVVDALREHGHRTESIAAIEPHQQGLHHLHQHLDTDADDPTISKIAANLLGIEASEYLDGTTGELLETAPASEWTTINITPVHPGGAAYPFKNLGQGLGKAHLELNGGKPYNFMTRGFFTSVGGMKIAAKAERKLNQIFKEELEPRFGTEATKISDTMRSAQEMMNYIRDDLYNKAMATKKMISRFISLGLNMTTTALDEAISTFEQVWQIQPQLSHPLTL